MKCAMVIGKIQVLFELGLFYESLINWGWYPLAGCTATA